MKRKQHGNLADARLDALCAFTGWGRYYALGFLHIWHALTQRSAIERGSLECITDTLPDFQHPDVTRTGLAKRLLNAGYIAQRGDTYSIVDNTHIAAKRAARQSAGRLGAQARISALHKKAETKAKARKKKALAKQDKALVASHPAQALAVASANPKKLVTDFWAIFAQEHIRLYGTDPLRNAKTNGQMAFLVKRVGVEELEGFLRFYMGHPEYRWCSHELGQALKNAESLYTEFKRQTPIIRKDLERQLHGDSMDAQMRRISSGEIA